MTAYLYIDYNYCVFNNGYIIIIGMLLTHMNTNEDAIRIIIKQHVKSITNKLSKIVREQ